MEMGNRKLSTPHNIQRKMDDTQEPIDCGYNSHGTQKVVVVETTMLLSHLQYVEELLTTTIAGYQVCILLPWCVLEHLDSLKTKESCDAHYKSAQRAAKAIRFLHFNLSRENARLKGQTPSEAGEKALEKKTIDEKILHCCIQSQEKYPNAQTILLTCHKSLAIKAMICGITACDIEHLSHLLKSWTRNYVAATSQTRSLQEEQQLCKSCEKFKIEKDKEMVLKKFYKIWSIMREMMTQFQVILTAEAHADKENAVNIMKNLLCLMIQLEGSYNGCLRGDGADFNALCGCLNAFCEKVNRTDSQLVEPKQVMQYFMDITNRHDLILGYEQLTAFIAETILCLQKVN